jgi:hypothetical protein
VIWDERPGGESVHYAERSVEPPERACKFCLRRREWRREVDKLVQR